MPVSYACIARGADGILSEFSTTENQQWSERAVKMLKKATDVADGKKLTFSYNFLGVRNCVFLCVADEASGRVLPYAFLTELSDVWVKLFKGEEPRESFTSFRAAIAQKMQKYSISGSDASSSEMAQLSSASSRGPLGLLPENGGQSGSNSPSTGPADPKAEKVRGIQRGLDEVKDVMASNIEKVMRRGEAIESLMDKSDNLSGSADRFRAQSTKLRKTLCWADFKVKVVLLLGVLVVLYFLIASQCGLTFNTC